MPTIPAKVTFNAKGVDILNAIRNNSTANYREYVPVADPTIDSLRNIGNIIMDMAVLKNEFISTLINRIALVLLTSKMYDNPWSVFNRGIIELGETVEEVFVNIAKPYEFDPAVAETQLYKRRIPDVRTAFHVMNYQKYFPVTISDEQLRTAFLTWNGLADLISGIVSSIYSGAAYDEFTVMKYLLARHLLDGHFYGVTVPEPTAANAHAITSAIKGISNNLEFMKTDYNMNGVATFTKKSDQYLILNAGFDAVMDVNVLASAFNMDKAEFMGHKITVDDFGAFDTDRLNLLFKDAEGNYVDGYTPLTSDEITALNSIPCVIVDKGFFMIFDKLREFTENYNGQGLYWNYFFHVWKTFSVSPFANAVSFIQGTPSVTSVTISPDAVTTVAGTVVRLGVTVVTANFASKAVNWSVDSTSATAGVTIDPYGTVTIPSTFEGESITVTAKSAIDATKYDTATITIYTPSE